MEMENRVARTAEKSRESLSTPGPWLLKDLSDEVGPYFVIKTKEASNSISDPVGFDLRGIIRAADARLIAAAPDLVEALQFLDHEFATASAGGPKSKPTIKQLNAIWERAQAALAKAGAA